MPEYAWREGGPNPKVDANVFGNVIAGLAEGDATLSVKPQAIVDEARKRGSPLRPLFDWNNDTAAEQWRCQQARHLLGRLVIVVVEQRSGRSMSSRAFYSIDVGQERGYMTSERVLSDRDLRLQVIASAKKELESYMLKYYGVLRFGNYIPHLEKIIADMQSEIARLAEAATKKPPPGGGKGKGKKK